MPLIPLLLGLAPTVAEWILGDKTGKAVGKVAGIAQDILGTSDADQIERAVAADPNLALQFKQAIIQAAAEEKRMELEAMKAQLADTQSARNTQVELAKTGSALSWSAAVVSVLAVASFAGILVAIFVFKGAIPPDLKDVFLLLIGAAISGYNQVLNYYLGSSSGSSSKDATLRAAVAGGKQA